MENLKCFLRRKQLSIILISYYVMEWLSQQWVILEARQQWKGGDNSLLRKLVTIGHFWRRTYVTPIFDWLLWYRNYIYCGTLIVLLLIMYNLDCTSGVLTFVFLLHCRTFRHTVAGFYLYNYILFNNICITAYKSLFYILNTYFVWALPDIIRYVIIFHIQIFSIFLLNTSFLYVLLLLLLLWNTFLLNLKCTVF